MLQVVYRKKGLKVSHVWFSSETQLASEEYKNLKASIYYLHGVSLNHKFGTKSKKTEQYSLIKDLDMPEEDLFQTLGKHLRQYIKRSIKENIVETKVIFGKQIINYPNLISYCGALYEKMFCDKGIDASFNSNLFKVYAENDALVLGLATINGNPIGFSAVIYHEKNARLWLAAFDFRNDSMDSQVLSRAHQRMDWETILWLKRKGVKFFDFGGVNSFESPDGITTFKMSFEKNNKVTYYNLLVPGNCIGKMLINKL